MGQGGKMAFLRWLFRWRNNKPVKRIRVCVECGMPVAEHKTWCSIFRTLQENGALAQGKQ